MDFAVFDHISNQLYQDTLIPTIAFDLAGRPLNTDMQINLNHLPQGLLVWEPDIVRVFSNYHFAVARMTFEPDDSRKLILLVGPVNLAGTSDEQINYNGHTYYRHKHYTQLTVEAFNRHISMMAGIANNSYLPLNAIDWHYISQPFFEANSVDKLMAKNLANRRAQDETFDSYQFELRFLEYLKRGNEVKINWIIKKMRDTYQIDLAENRMEALRLKFSALTAVLTRTAIAEAAPLNQALSLSDAAIQGLTHVKTPDEWYTYLQDTIERFARMISKFSLGDHSSLVKLTVNYIDNHLYDKILLADIADFTEYNPNYLSTRFREETGKTIHAYIREQKIIEAQHLLLFSNQSAHAIGTQLGFSSQSHFIDAFQRVTHMTPRQYQEAHTAYYLA